MGPIIVLDKSAFQGLSVREFFFLEKHFMHNATPVLVYEILGDLTKKAVKGREPQDKVMALSRRLQGFSYFNENYRVVCATTMMGATFEPHRIVADNYFFARTEDAMVVETSPLRPRIDRWAGGQFSETDQSLSQLWRSATRSLSFQTLNAALNREHVLVPPPDDEAGIVRTADQLLGTASLQGVWLEWLIEQLNPDRDARELLRARWRDEGFRYLREMSDYAYHCVRALLALVVAVRHRHLKWDATHAIDVQYLYYLRFCMVMSSDDHVHRLLAPQLMDEEQSFITGVELKAGLRELADESEQLDDSQRSRREFALGSYPLLVGTGIINRLWRRHFGEWPGSGNRAVSLSEADAAKALSEARALVATEAPLSAPRNVP